MIGCWRRRKPNLRPPSSTRPGEMRRDEEWWELASSSASILQLDRRCWSNFNILAAAATSSLPGRLTLGYTHRKRSPLTRYFDLRLDNNVSDVPDRASRNRGRSKGGLLFRWVVLDPELFGDLRTAARSQSAMTSSSVYGLRARCVPNVPVPAFATPSCQPRGPAHHPPHSTSEQPAG